MDKARQVEFNLLVQEKTKVGDIRRQLKLTDDDFSEHFKQYLKDTETCSFNRFRITLENNEKFKQIWHRIEWLSQQIPYEDDSEYKLQYQIELDKLTHVYAIAVLDEEQINWKTKDEYRQNNEPTVGSVSTEIQQGRIKQTTTKTL